MLKRLCIKKYIYIFLPLIFALSQFNKGLGQDKVLVNVKDFGAKGDGKTDDYAALLKVVDYINNKGKGEVYFPAGNYYIAEFHDGKNKVKDLQFQNCDGLTIRGSNAVISVNGNFNREFTKKIGKDKYSNITALIPLKIDHCKNVAIENIEFNGNVDKMARDTGIVEGPGYLLVISESQNVNMTDLFLHHAQTDGILIWGTTNKNITGKGIVSSNNARVGMALSGLTDGTFTACKFINSGITEGRYGPHPPRAGVDVENHTKGQKVNNIHFVSCLFENNLGSQFVCSTPVTSQNIFFNNCTFNSGINSSIYTIIVYALNVVFESCNFDCKNGDIVPSWKGQGSSTFKKCKIVSSASGILAPNETTTSKVVIDSCDLKYSGTQKVTTFFPNIKMRNLSFTNNTVHIPKQYAKAAGNSILIECTNKSGNKFLND